jgi:hypothetical protein
MPKTHVGKKRVSSINGAKKTRNPMKKSETSSLSPVGTKPIQNG